MHHSSRLKLRDAAIPLDAAHPYPDHHTRNRLNPLGQGVYVYIAPAY